MKAPQLFSEYNLKKIRLKNRIVMAPMCQFSANTSGMVTDWHFHHYVSRAIGGTGLIMIEATAVESTGRLTNSDIGLWSDRQIEPLSKIVSACKRYGATMGVQLSHAGRKSKLPNQLLFSASAIPHEGCNTAPQVLTQKGIKAVAISFAQATKRALLAGFDMIEIQAGHGYLIHQFLSPVSNNRLDEYGVISGKNEFLCQVLEGVKNNWPDEHPISIRVSVKDSIPGGNDIEDTIATLKSIKNYVDVVHVSSGGMSNSSKPTNVKFQEIQSSKIRHETDLITIAGGSIISGPFAENGLSAEKCDLVFVGRALLRNPYWPYQAANELGMHCHYPEPYKSIRYMR